MIMRDVAARALAKLREWGPDKCLLALAAVMAVLLLVQGVRFGLTLPLGRRLAQYLRSSSGAPPERNVARTIEAYDVIFEKGVIGTKVQARPPKLMLMGVMGNRALLGTSPKDAKLYEVGTQLPQGGKLVEIGSDKVVVEIEGKQKTITVFPELKQGAPGQQGGPPGAPGPRGMPGPGPVPGPGGPRPAVAEPPQQSPPGAEVQQQTSPDAASTEPVQPRRGGSVGLRSLRRYSTIEE